MNKLMVRNHVIRPWLILLLITFAASAGYSQPDDNAGQGRPVESEQQIQVKLHDLADRINHHARQIKQVSADLPGIQTTVKRHENEIDGLSHSRRSFEDFSRYGDSIGLTAVLVGLMAIVLTAIAIIAVISFYKTHGYMKRVEETVVLNAERNIEQQTNRFMKESVTPEVQKKLANLEIDFWRLTHAANRVSHEQWERLRDNEDIEDRVDRLLKFQLGVSHLVSRQEAGRGLEFFYHTRQQDLPPMFEAFLYRLYREGIFDESKDLQEKFTEFIEHVYDRTFDAWLKNMKKNI
ncbi:MAG: hypothetical protein JRE64_03275 [Deltaproteobacteria bacterium]|nr:hypothetical protein [Deltaproteobacteria bacterium]